MTEFNGLVERELPRLRRYARALTRSADRADDLKIRSRRTLLRHPGLAQAGEISGFVQRADLRHPQPRTGMRLQAGHARKKISVQLPGFGKFSDSAFGFTSEGTRGGEAAVRYRYTR